MWTHLALAFHPKLLISDLRELTLKQRAMLALLCLAILAPSIMDGTFMHLTGLGLVYILAGLSGIICVYLISLRKLSNYQYGVINAFLYGAAAYHSTYYGDAALNFFFYFPCQFIGAYWWSQHMYRSEVNVRGLSFWQAIAYLALLVLSILGYGYYLVHHTDDAMPYVDSATNMLSIFAMLLMLKGYWEQWLGWIIVDVLSVWMWIRAGKFDPQAYAVLVMWIAYLGNSIYGAIQWLMAARCQENHWEQSADKTIQ